MKRKKTNEVDSQRRPSVVCLREDAFDTSAGNYGGASLPVSHIWMCVQDVLESWVLNGVIFLMWEEKMCIH